VLGVVCSFCNLLTVCADGGADVCGLHCAFEIVCVGIGVCLVCVGGVGSSVTQSIGISGLCVCVCNMQRPSA